MNAATAVFGLVAYLAVASAIGAAMSASRWRDAAHRYQRRLEAREALCQDRRCRLEFDPEPIPFFPDRGRSADRPQETGTPG